MRFKKYKTMQIKRNLFILVFALSGFLSGCSVKQKEQKKPNIIFLMTDDQRWDNMGCYGRPEFNTPNIDKLSNEGITFDKAYYAVAICMPSRVTMMTGRFNSNHRVGFVAPEDYTLSRADFAKGYPAILKKAGYRTGFIGKVGFTVTEETTRPSTPKEHFYKKNMGNVFDFFAGSESYDYQGFEIWPEDDQELKEIYKKGRQNSGRTMRTGEAILRFLDTQPKDQPFCLSVSFYAVKHDRNSDVYWPDYEQYKEREMSVPDNWVVENEKLPDVVKENARGVRLHRERSSTPEKYQNLVRRFATQGYSVDHQVGLLMKKLKEKGMLENTVIIYTSDNGRFQGSHGLFDKCLLYEESIKAPLIVYDGRKNETEQGFRDDALISSVDMAPTILSLAGLNIPESMQGRDLSGILNKTQDMSDWRDAVFMEDLFINEMFSARNKKNEDEINENMIKANRSYRSHGICNGRYKYFVYYEHHPKIEELYDLKNDSLEQNNLANNPEYTEILTKMRKQTETMYQEILP